MYQFTTSDCRLRLQNENSPARAYNFFSTRLTFIIRLLQKLKEKNGTLLETGLKQVEKLATHPCKRKLGVNKRLKI